MGHRTYKVEETEQAKAVLTHDVIEGTVTAIDFDTKKVNVDLDAPYKPRHPTATDFGRLQEDGYAGLPASPEVTQLTNVEIVYNCETAVENPAGAFRVGDTILVLAIGTDYYAVGFPDEVKRCVSEIWLRPTIDGKALPYAGQQFSISFKKEGQAIYTDTAEKSVWGTWGTADPRLYGICGPYSLENWDQGPVRVNLHRARDKSAWRGSEPGQKFDNEVEVINPGVNGADPPFGIGEGKELKAWTDLDLMFNYAIKDPAGSYFDYLMQNTGAPNTSKGQRLGSASCRGLKCPFGHVIGPATNVAIAHMRIDTLGFGNALPSSQPQGAVYTQSTQKYRVAQEIYVEVPGTEIISGVEIQEVFNRDTDEFTQGQVLERNFGFGLKQRRIARQRYFYNQQYHPNLVGKVYGYGRFSGYGGIGVSSRARSFTTFYVNGGGPTYDMAWFLTEEGSYSVRLGLSQPNACLYDLGIREYGTVGVGDGTVACPGPKSLNLMDFTGDLDVLTLQQSMITINDEGSPLSTDFPAEADYTISQPRENPAWDTVFQQSLCCGPFSPMQWKFSAAMVSMEDLWF